MPNVMAAIEKMADTFYKWIDGGYRVVILIILVKSYPTNGPSDMQ